MELELHDLLNLSQEIQSIHDNRKVLIAETGSATVETHAVAERRISAFLSACSSFRDKLLKEVRLKKPSHSDEFLAIVSDMADRSPDYRICYALRNFSQHESNILHVIPVKAKLVDGAMAYGIEFLLDSDRILLEGSRLTAKVKADLKALPDRIPAMPLLVEYFRMLRILFVSFLGLFGAQNAEARGYREALERAMTDMPPDASPMLFHGLPDPTAGEDFNTGATSFSFDELDILDRIIRAALEDTHRAAQTAQE